MAQRVIEATELLIDQPHLGRPGPHSGAREWVVHGTPYILVYRVSEEIIRKRLVLPMIWSDDPYNCRPLAVPAAKSPSTTATTSGS
jgi:hypothetical protein